MAPPLVTTRDGRRTGLQPGRDDLGAVEWSVAARALDGGDVSGDAFVAEQRDHRLLLAVVDGLGHGQGAQVAATTATSVLARYANDDLTTLVQACHRALISTRGAVLSAAVVDLAADSLTWLGIGNVEGAMYRHGTASPPVRDALIQRGGIVGYNLPALRPATLAIRHGDLLVFATDGIRSSFVKEVRHLDSPDQIANQILADHARDSDDALVLVARYHRSGESSPR